MKTLLQNHLLGLTLTLGEEGVVSFLLAHSSSCYSTCQLKRVVAGVEDLPSCYQVKPSLEVEVGVLAHLKEVVAAAKRLILEVS